MLEELWEPVKYTHTHTSITHQAWAAREGKTLFYPSVKWMRADVIGLPHPCFFHRLTQGSKTICHKERQAPRQAYTSVSSWKLDRCVLEWPKPEMQVTLATNPQGASYAETERTNFDEILVRQQSLVLSFMSHVI